MFVYYLFTGENLFGLLENYNVVLLFNNKLNKTLRKFVVDSVNNFMFCIKIKLPSVSKFYLYSKINKFYQNNVNVIS